MILIAALDDVSGVTTSYVIEKLHENGANSVHITQTVTKKGRMGLLFFIDVDEKDLEAVGEVLMTELGSLGYNVIKTNHIRATTRVYIHKVIIRNEKGRYEEPVTIKRSFSPKGKLVRVEPESDDLVRIIEGVKKKFGLDITLRELKKKIQADTSLGHEETIIELPSS